MSWNGDPKVVRQVGAFFAHARVPEQCSGEMLIAEMQRVFCFGTLDDAFIQNTGSSLIKKLRVAEEDVRARWLSRFVEDIAHYPPPTKQAKKHDVPYVIPLTPAIAMFSTPRRVTKRSQDATPSADRSWKPGLYITECLSYCEHDEAHLQALFSKIKTALAVGEGDDLFAKYIDKNFEQALKEYTGVDVAARLCPDLPHPDACPMSVDTREAVRNAPLTRLAGDIEAVIAVKVNLSRRQFMAMLETIVRLGTASHVLWLCSILIRLERAIEDFLNGQRSEITEKDILGICNFPAEGILGYGSNFLLKIKAFFKEYELRSQKMNLLLSMLIAKSAQHPSIKLDWSTPGAVAESLQSVKSYIDQDPAFLQRYNIEFSEYYQGSLKKFSLAVDSQSTHLMRFVIDALSQNVDYKDSRFTRYDQSYFVRRRTHSPRSMLIVNAGAVALMTLVHCCSFKNRAVLLSNLQDALSSYGIGIPKSELEKFKNQLRELGLTIDSPDAESGMVLQDIVSA